VPLRTVRVLGLGGVRLQADLDVGEEEPELASEADGGVHVAFAAGAEGGLVDAAEQVCLGHTLWSLGRGGVRLQADL